MIEVGRLCKVFHSAAKWRELLRGRMRGSEVIALDAVSFHVERGEVMGLMGPNGAGKSTLLRILAGMVLPTSGEIRIGGTVALVVADERSFSWRLSGRANLEFFANLYGYSGADAARRIDSAFEHTALTALSDRPYREYSTGARQRLALARGLLSDADILLLDEPTRGVDPEAALGLRRFLRDELAGKCKRTLLVATHDLQEMQEICARVAVLREGRIVRIATASQIASAFRDASPVHA